MQFSIFLLIFMFSCAYGKTHLTKTLTESMGQEVIEIGAPVKDLPPGLDEEPSAEFEDDEKTSMSVPTTTKRETRKTTTLPSSVVTQKVAIERRSDDISSEDEEKQIEKELSDVYKDNDYKGETTEISTAGMIESLPVLRQRGKVNFQFQPDVNDRADVERFRTSVDEISCEKRVTQRLLEKVTIVVLKPGSGDDTQKLQEETSSSGLLLRSSVSMCSALLLTFICL